MTSIKTLRTLLSLLPRECLTIRVPFRPYPRHWKRNQQKPQAISNIGDQLKTHRLKWRLRQVDVARRLGVHWVSVSNWERGATTPSRRMKLAIAVLLARPPVVTDTQSTSSVVPSTPAPREDLISLEAA